MARIVVSTEIDRPVAAVWEHLSDLESHVWWMTDAGSIRITSSAGRGVGTTMVVATRVGPFRTNDFMEVVGWEEGRSITVRHRGLITGSGELSVEPENGASRVTWSERLTFPWWLGGPLTAWIARPVLRRIWSKNLERLALLVNGP